MEDRMRLPPESVFVYYNHAWQTTPRHAYSEKPSNTIGLTAHFAIFVSGYLPIASTVDITHSA